MFHFFKQQKPPKDCLLALSAEELLVPYQQSIEQIHQQVGVPESHWYAVYYQLIANFAEQVQLLPASESHHSHLGGLLSHSLEVSLHALKFRKSKMLPLGAAVDVIEQQKELWSYAIFSAALLHDIGKIHTDQTIQIIQNSVNLKKTKTWTSLTETLTRGAYYKIAYRHQHQHQNHAHQSISLLFASKLLPKSGLNWIASNAEILNDWTNYLTTNISATNTLADIIIRADKLSTQSKNPSLASLSSSKPERKDKPNKPLSNNKPNKPKASQKNIGKDFINWISQGIADGSLPVNTANAPLHTFGENKDLILISPLIFKKYANQNNTTYQQVQHDFQSLKLHKINEANKNLWKFEIINKRNNKKGNSLDGMLIERAEEKLEIRLPLANMHLEAIQDV